MASATGHTWIGFGAYIRYINGHIYYRYVFLGA
ncbi:hypothetical protein PPBDW_II0394 [Photobacterium kishitanii]|nr:hypothetical protein PPBDW_II0394 [Photobacterium kishitanii]